MTFSRNAVKTAEAHQGQMSGPVALVICDLTSLERTATKNAPSRSPQPNPPTQ